MLHIRLIGRPRLERDGEVIEGPKGNKSWALLARLVRSADPVSRQRLVDELFFEAQDPMGALRWSLAELRRRTGLGDSFTGNPVVASLGDDVVIDVDEAAQNQISGQIPEGEFLEGISVKGSPGFDSWLMVERQRVDADIVSALRQATLRSISSRAYDRAVDLANATIRRTPFDEGPHILLIKAFAESGDAESAMQQVEATEKMFRTELGVAPSSAVREAARPKVAAAVPGVSLSASASSLLDAGLAALDAGAADAGLECLRRAASDAELSGDSDLQARCLLELGTALIHAVRGYDDEGAVMLGSAIEAATSSGSELVVAKSYSELAYMDLLAGRRTSATEYLANAETYSAGDPTLQATVAGLEAMNLSDWGRVDQAAERFAEAVELCQSAGATRRMIWTLGLGSRTFYLADRFEEAADWAERACAGAIDERWTAFRPWPATWLASSQLQMGVEPSVVKRELESTFALARQIGDPCWEGIAAKGLGLTYAAENDSDSALEWMANASTLCRRVTDSYGWVETDILVTEAQTALVFGDNERAENVARGAIGEAARTQMDGLLQSALDVLAAVT